MYPPYIDPVQIDLQCCNSIGQCATTTFTVSPTDTAPSTAFSSDSPYVTQYDPYEDVGQHFTWAATKTWFWDDDASQSTDSSYPYTYDVTVD